jgi:hypothetical protein
MKTVGAEQEDVTLDDIDGDGIRSDEEIARQKLFTKSDLRVVHMSSKIAFTRSSAETSSSGQAYSGHSEYLPRVTQAQYRVCFFSR